MASCPKITVIQRFIARQNLRCIYNLPGEFSHDKGILTGKLYQLTVVGRSEQPSLFPKQVKRSLLYCFTTRRLKASDSFKYSIKAFVRVVLCDDCTNFREFLCQAIVIMLQPRLGGQEVKPLK